MSIELGPFERPGADGRCASSFCARKQRSMYGARSARTRRTLCAQLRLASLPCQRMITVIKRASRSETITRLPANPAKSCNPLGISAGRSKTALLACSGLDTNSKLNAVKCLELRVTGHSTLQLRPENSEKGTTDFLA